MKWLCSIGLILSCVFVALGQNERKRSIPLTEQAVDSLLFHGIELSPQFINRNSRRDEIKKENHHLEVYFNGDLEEFPDPQRQYFQFHLNQEQYFFPTFYEGDDSIWVVLHNIMGERLLKADVYAGQVKRTNPLTEHCGCFVVKKDLENPLLKVKYEGHTGYFQLGKESGSRPYSRSVPLAPKPKGYIALSKPRYRVQDTLQFKVFALNEKGQPYSEKLRFEINSTSTSEKWRLNVNSNHPGSYYGFRQLNDSFFQGQFWLSVFDSSGKKILSQEFVIGAYELPEYTIYARVKKDVFAADEKVQAHLNTYRANQWPALGLHYEWSVALEEVLDFTGALSVPLKAYEELYMDRGVVDPSGTTVLNVPNSVFLAQKASYHLRLRVLDAQGVEQYQWSKEIEKALVPAPFRIVDSGKMTTLDVYGTSKAGIDDLFLESHSRYGYRDRSTIKANEPWPASEGTVKYHLYKGDSQIAVHAIPPAKALQVSGRRTADSIIIQVHNTENALLYYRILQGTSIVDAGVTQELSYTALTNNSEEYRIEVFYSDRGLSRLVQETFSLNPDRITLHAKVPRLIAPGSLQRIELKATDALGKPLPATDVTAFANDARFTDVPHSRLHNVVVKDAQLRPLPADKASFSSREPLSGAWFGCLSMYGADSLQALNCPGKEHRRFVRNENGVSALTPLVRDSGEWELPDYLWVDDHLIFSKVSFIYHNGDFVLPPGQYDIAIGYRGYLFTFNRVLIQKNKSSLLLFEPANYGRYVPFSKEAKWQEKQWLKEAVAKGVKMELKSVYGYYDGPNFELEYASGNRLKLGDASRAMRKVVRPGRSYYIYPYAPFSGAKVLMSNKEVHVDSDSFYMFKKGVLTSRKSRPSMLYAQLYLRSDMKVQRSELSRYGSLEHFTRSIWAKRASISPPRKVSYSSRIVEASKKEYLPSHSSMVGAHFYFQKGFFQDLRLMNTQSAAASAVLDISETDQRHFSLLPGTYLCRARTKGYPVKYYFDTIEVFENKVLYYRFKKGRLTSDHGFSYRNGDTLAAVASQLVENRSQQVSCIDFLGLTIRPSKTPSARFQVHQAGGGTMIPLPNYSFQLTKDDSLFQLRTDAEGWAEVSDLELGLYCLEFIAPEYGDTVKTFLVITGDEQVEARFKIISQKQYQQRSEAHYSHITRKQLALKVPDVLNPDGLRKISLGGLRVRAFNAYGDFEGTYVFVKKEGVVLKRGIFDHSNFCYLPLPAGVYTMVLSHVSFGKKEFTIEVENNTIIDKSYELSHYFHQLKTVVISEYHPRNPSYGAPVRLESQQASPVHISFNRARNRTHRSPSGAGVQIAAPVSTKEPYPEQGFLFMEAEIDSAKETPVTSESTPMDSIREDFSELAYWKPSLLTDKNGKTHFEVKFPDDLTTWKHYFIAMNLKGQSGLKYTTSQSFRTVHTSLAVPPFLCEGDSLVLCAQHFNYETEKKFLKETVLANGAVLHQKDIELGNTLVAKTNMRVAGQDSIEFSSAVSAGNVKYDEVRYKIPVKDTTIGRQLYVTQALKPGEVKTVRGLGTEKPIGFFPTTNHYLESLMGQLAGYRYGCVEQTSSKLFALVYEAKIAKLTNRSFGKEEEVDLVVKRLLSLKNDNGLWGWWNGQETNWWMVSYATRALLTAQKEGFDIYGGAAAPLATLATFIKRSQEVHPMLELLLLQHGAKYSSDAPDYFKNDFSLLEQLQLLRIAQLKGKGGIKEEVLDLATDVNGQLTWGESTYRMEDHVSTTTLCALEILFYEMPFQEWYNNYMVDFLTLKKTGWGKYNTLEMARVIGLMADVKQEHSGGLLVNGEVWAGAKNEIHLSANETAQLENTSPFTMLLLLPSESSSFTSTEHKPSFTVTSRLKKEGKYTDSLLLGDEAIIEVELHCTKAQEKLMLEVPLPAGCVALPFDDRNGVLHHRIFNDQVSLFCTRLSPGRHVFRIPVRASYQGNFTMLPTTASLMYFDFVTTSTPPRPVMVSALE